jgi:outer membrane protein
MRPLKLNVIDGISPVSRIELIHVVIACVIVFATFIPGFPARVAQCGEGNSTSASTLTLENAVSMALVRNNRVDNARLQVEKAGDEISAARTKLFPEIDFDVYHAYHLTGEAYEFEKGVFGTYPVIGPVPAQNVGIDTARDFTTLFTASIKQPISQLYEISLFIKQKKVQKDIFQQDLRSRRQETADKVKETYCGILKTEASLKAVEEKIVFLKELDKLVDRYVAEERSLKSESLDVKARLAEAEYEAFSAKNALATQKEHLNELMGRDIGTPFRVVSRPDASPYEINTGDAEKKALSQRPEVLAANLNLEYSEDEVSLKKAQYIPEISLLFRYSYNFNVKLLPENIATIGLYAKWDIIDWGLKQTEIAQKRKAVSQARNLLSETESRVRLDVNEKIRKLQESRLFIDVTSKDVIARKEKLRTEMNKYRQNSALLQELLEAQSNLEVAEEKHQQAILDYWTSKANLEKALGEI